MERDWARLGTALAAARDQAGLTQADVARRLGVGKSTIQSIERGVTRAKPTPSIRVYAQLVGWTEGSVEQVLAGGEPVTGDSNVEQLPTAAVEAGPEDLSLHVIQALRDGPLLDSQVLHVHTPGGEITATIVVRGETDATPEELHAALLAWRDRRRALHANDDPSAVGE